MKKLFTLVVLATLCLFFGGAVMCGGQIEPAADNLSIQRHDGSIDVKDVATEDTSVSISPFTWKQTSGNNTFVFGTNPKGTTVLPNATTAGDLLVLAARSGEANGSINPPTDTAGNTWHLAYDEPDNGTNNGHMAVYYAFNCKAAAAGNKVSITGNTGVNDINDLVAVEYAGVVSNANPLDTANGAFSTSGGPTSVPLTTTTSGDLLIGWTTSSNGQTTPGATTPDNRYRSGNDLYEDGVAAGSGMLNITSQPTDSSFNAIAVAFRASGIVPQDGGMEAEAGPDVVESGTDAADGGDASDGPVEEGGTDSGPPTGKWVSGYYAAYASNLLPVQNIQWSGMSHILVAFYVPNANGSVDRSLYTGTQAGGDALAQQIITAAHAHGVKAIASLGGQNSSPGFEGAMSASNNTTFISNLQSILALGYDGFDVDCEGGPDSDQLTVVAALGQQMKAADPGIIMTATAGWQNSNVPDNLSNYVQVVQYYDQLNIMTYEMSSSYWGWALTWESDPLFNGGQAQTPSSVDISIGLYEQAGILPGKLGFGIGAYGECWGPPATGPQQPVNGSITLASDNTMSFGNIMAYYYNSNAYHFDPVGQTPYLSFTGATGPNGCQFITYDDAAGIQAKGNYLKTKSGGLGGVIIWQINEATLLDGITSPLLTATDQYILH